MREFRNLEFKETVTNTYLKTVSAFANYGTGEILFGVADDGSIRGVDDPVKTCLDIENRINDSIVPVPSYRFEIDEKQKVIHLIVEEGLHKPYLYRSKAYRRNDSATIEADRLELSRLILEGEDASFEELPARSQDLTFTVLTEKLVHTMQLRCVDRDTLKTLELYREESGLNIAAELLADSNSFCGIDMVRFGDSLNIILDRETYSGQSVLKQYDQAVTIYRKYYQYDEIKGALRETISLIPEEAFREAIANAIVHRAWDVNSHITVSMFADRIEITSPGGLPRGMHPDEYCRGGISIPGNRILATVFLRLQMIERFGTGIRRIQESYRASRTKPTFAIGENSIRITLPVLNGSPVLTKDEESVYACLRGRYVSSSQIAAGTGFGRNKVVTILKKLVSAGTARVNGTGRGTRYTAE